MAVHSRTFQRVAVGNAEAVVVRWLLCLSLAINPASLSIWAEETPGVSPIVNSELDVVLREWAMRRETLSAGQFIWRLRGRNRSRLYRIAVEPSRTAEPEESVRVHFSGQGLKFEGNALPALQLGRSSLPDGQAIAMNRGFRTALMADKIENDAVSYHTAPYVVVIERHQELHLWEKPSEGIRCQVVFPIGTAGPLLFFDYMRADKLPVLWGLVEGLRLALYPDFLLNADQDVQSVNFADVRPIMDGRQCRTLEFRLRNLPTETICHLVVDPSRKDLVVRATYLSHQNVLLTQYDIEYDQDDAGEWWPRFVTLVQFNEFGDAYDELLMERTEAKSSSASSILLSQSPVAGTWVIDQIAGTQYVVEAADQHRVVPLSEASAMVTQPRRGFRLVASRKPSAVLSIGSKFLTWPGILLTLAVLYGGLALGIRVARSCRRVQTTTHPTSGNSG